MSAYPGGHAGLLAVALSTHALVGYALGAVLFDRPRAGLVGGLLADVDFLLPAAWGAPFVHRGVTHGAPAAIVIVAVVAFVHRDVGWALGTGYASHLLIDATTPMAIPLFSPLSDQYVGVALGGHSPPATAALWVCSIGAVLWHRTRRRGYRPDADGE